MIAAVFAAAPASAVERIASEAEIAVASCARDLYQGLNWGAHPDRCTDEMFFLPASAAVKCSLYHETGYPSGLMQKACQLFDQGVIERFLEGADAGS